MLVGIWMILVSVTLGFPTRQQRLSLAEWGSYNFRDHKGPGTYAFGYDIEDPITNNIQFRQEERHLNGSVTGSYGYVEPDGHVRIMHYIADTKGYRVSEEIPPSINFRPSTTPRPQQQYRPMFEGEFTPVTEVNEHDEYHPIDDEFDNTQPIQFPSTVQLPPPLNDGLRLQNYIPKDVTNDHSSYAGYNFQQSQPPQRLALIYQNPWGVNRGTVKFRVRGK